jgi:hypothetical protein
MKLTSISLLTAMVVAASCSQNASKEKALKELRTEDQVAFENGISRYDSVYSKVKETNQPRRHQVIQEIEAYAKQYSHVDRWVGNVLEVNDWGQVELRNGYFLDLEGEIVLDTMSANPKNPFVLKMEEMEQIKKHTSTLQIGDRLRFSGDLKLYLNLSLFGNDWRPEYFIEHASYSVEKTAAEIAKDEAQENQ